MIALDNAKRVFPIEGDLTHSDAGERYAQVVERLRARSGSSRQVLITSAGSDEGKTVTAVNLAFAFHASRIPVLLAELSFTRPAFSEIFSPSPSARGIEDVLADGVPLEATVCARVDNNLPVAMVKRRQPNDLLLSPSTSLTRLFAEASAHFEWTIFDGPSADSSHIRTLAASVGLVLLVARARQTTTTKLEEALARIGHPHTMVLLNDS